MIFRLLKSNSAVSYLVFPVLAVVFWSVQLKNRTGYPFYEGENSMVLFRIADWLLKTDPVAASATALVLIVMTGILIQRLNNEFSFFKTKTVLPSTIYILIVCGFPDLQDLHPVHFSVLFLLLAIYRLFSSFDIRKPFSHVFEAGFLIGIGSLFYLNTLVLIPAVLLGASILGKETRWREFFLTLTGICIPWVFNFAWHFVSDSLPELSDVLHQNLTTNSDRISGNPPAIAYLGFLLILTLAGSIRMIIEYEEKKISLRKYFKIFFFLFGCTLLAVLLIPPLSIEVIILAALPVSFLLSNFLISLKRQTWGDLVIYSLIGFNVYALLGRINPL
jgi:hypothetical protein